MNYYIEKNKKIVLFDIDKQRIKDTLNFIPQYQDLKIQETTRNIVELNGEFVFEDEVQDELAKARQKEFENKFFEIIGVGWYRKQPEGYSSAIESINTAFNSVTILGSLPANTLIFYQKPDFTKEEQCTEEWLIAHQFKNQFMTKTEFGQFYAKFVETWNKQEHLK